MLSNIRYTITKQQITRISDDHMNTKGALQLARSENSNKTGQMLRLILEIACRIGHSICFDKSKLALQSFKYHKEIYSAQQA